MNTRHGNTKALLYRVRPVAGSIPDPDKPEDWGLPVPVPGQYKKSDRFYNEKRRVLLVRHLFEQRGKNRKTDKTPNALKDYFYIDVPKYFFGAPEADGEDRTDFVARPLYTEDDVLTVQWTGHGNFSGWAETNTQMRAAGVASSVEAGGVVCAKWS